MEQATTVDEPRAASDTATADSKHLTFALGGEAYGLPILRVREINGLLPITIVPDAPAAIRGVINLRGRIIPVMDLRRRFGLEGDSAEFERACIIVVEISKDDGLVDIGILVDEVQGVLSIDAERTEMIADQATHAAANCVSGLANIDGGVCILIDVDQLLNEAHLHEALAARS